MKHLVNPFAHFYTTLEIIVSLFCFHHCRELCVPSTVTSSLISYPQMDGVEIWNCEIVPAEVWRENVNAFVLGEQRMESASVRPVDAVALVGLPEGQLAAIEHIIISLPF